jgi:MSHA biogenesis protein MshM
VYLEHFGLSEWPFALTPNMRFAVELPGHREALAVVRAALSQGDGFVSVVGEVGSGKSLLARWLLRELRAERATALIANPALSPRALLTELAGDFGLEMRDPPAAEPLVLRLGRRLLELARGGRTALVVVDEAQALPDASFETLRLLTNLETKSGKQLQVVVLGQPELDARLARPRLRQVRQRIVVRHALRPLGRHEIGIYVDRRLRLAGWSGGALFEDAALRALGRASRGVPRLINVLAHKSLLAGFGEGAWALSRRHVARAIADTPDALPRRRPWRRLRWLGSAHP